eukprot:7828399-Alexandrium_andersonii.AAC.1
MDKGSRFLGPCGASLPDASPGDPALVCGGTADGESRVMPCQPMIRHRRAQGYAATCHPLD